jgi:hypothetical protein
MFVLGDLRSPRKWQALIDELNLCQRSECPISKKGVTELSRLKGTAERWLAISLIHLRESHLF